MRKHFTHTPGLPDKKFLDNVAAFVKNKDRVKAKVGGSKQADNSKIRSSQLVWLPNSGYFREVLWNHVEEMNRHHYDFNVTRVCGIQYTEYHASEKGHYNWHVDTHFFEDVMFDRKISVTVQLSDPSEYDGGDFEIQKVKLPDTIKNKGSVLTFPSYMLHRVNPVTRGVRRSLVAWFEGPRWR